jgi:hypothetical protein
MKTPLAIVLSILVAAGVGVATQLGAQTTSTSAAPTGTLGSPTLPTVQNVVEITRAVPAGTTGVDAFTVPAGVTLVVTDIMVTNTGTAAACGGAVNRTGGTTVAPARTDTTGTPTTTGTTGTPTVAPPPAITTEGASGTSQTTVMTPTTSVAGATGTTTSVGTLTQTDSTVTGPLCVPAQTTTALPLTTGIEFAAGQVVQLLNAPAAAATPGAAGTLAFHLRGVLMTTI